MEKLRKLIEDYTPCNEQETADKEMMIEYMNTFEDTLTRENKVCHFTASSWIVNKERTKVLMIYHNIYDSWAWTGGHCDGDPDVLHVALKEAEEETGIKDGVIWVSTGNGISRIHDGKIDNYNSSCGLPADGIFQIIVDYTKTAWFTSNLGVFCAKYSDFEDYAEARKNPQTEI